MMVLYGHKGGVNNAIPGKALKTLKAVVLQAYKWYK